MSTFVVWNDIPTIPLQMTDLLVSSSLRVKRSYHLRNLVFMYKPISPNV